MNINYSISVTEITSSQETSILLQLLQHNCLERYPSEESARFSRRPSPSLKCEKSPDKT